ncbi:MAG: 50S ribosomal protein L23 [Candidatus Omnitrophota bacterium]
MSRSHEILITLLRTEKGAIQAEIAKYFFSVDPKANKIEIRKAVEEVYKVKVASVNTLRMPGKLKRVRQQLGMTSEWKKAIVTLKPGSKIDLA